MTSYGEAYVWGLECAVVECDCGEELMLAASEAICRCGTDHTALVCEEGVSDGKMHPWDEEYRDRRKERDEYLRAVHHNWLVWRVIEQWRREKIGGRRRCLLTEIQALCTT